MPQIAKTQQAVTDTAFNMQWNSHQTLQMPLNARNYYNQFIKNFIQT